MDSFRALRRHFPTADSMLVFFGVLHLHLLTAQTGPPKGLVGCPR